MPELKHNFTKGKMNKDVDERIVPDGQYRDALNVQVSTSDGSNVGAMQTLMGNTLMNDVYNDGTYDVPTTATCVGSIAAPHKDKVYYFISAGDRNDNDAFLNIRRDYIMEYDAIVETLKYVFVDIYYVAEQINVATVQADHIIIPSLSALGQNASGVRIGMSVTGTIGTVEYISTDNVVVHDIQLILGTTNVRVYLRQNGEVIAVNGAVNDTIEFTSPNQDRILNFNKNTIITGINVVDEFIYWTDNASEPKRVHIKRALSGTGGSAPLGGTNSNPFLSQYDDDHDPDNSLMSSTTNVFHTRLVEDNDGEMGIVRTADGKRPIWFSLENATVIRKSPTQPLKLTMRRDAEQRIQDFGNGEINDAFVSDSDLNVEGFVAGDTIDNVNFDDGVDFRVNDILLLATASTTDNIGTFNDYQIRARVVSSPSANPNPNNLLQGPFSLFIISIAPGLTANDLAWYVRIENKDSLFEFKFARFSYRYKYQDGEYSTFAPWSQVAFLPDTYEYEPKKGYNLGMVNQLRAVTLEYYHHQENTIPQDVVQVDILYKDTVNPTVYSVKTIKNTDAAPLWPILVDGAYSGTSRGSYTLTTDLIHSVLPSNQLFRPWDNVPRRAKAQEISANRLIYGNYLQNYTVLKDPALLLGIETNSLGYFNSEYALPSVKSVRSYQMGVVFSDRFGRETPVLTSEDSKIRVEKQNSSTRNRIQIGLMAKVEPPSWAHYYSFYIKEPTVEYYTMAMDRWYKAEDGCIWISFPSSERNKLQEEDFIILKKAHGSDVPVYDKARYRVLSIDNEAPDFVKTKRRSLGTLWNTNNDTIGNSTRGYPLQDTTNVTVKNEMFKQAFGDPLEWLRTPDKMTIRFHGNGQTSEEYVISKLSPTGSVVKIKIEGGFKEDVAFASENDTYASRIDNLAIELIEHKLENKPEFDGRFFVKIHRDSVLETYVLNNGDINYVVQEAWQLRYVNNNGYKNAGTAGAGVSSPIPNNPRERDHNVNGAGIISGISTSSADDASDATADTYSRHPTRFANHDAYYWGGEAQGDVPGGDEEGTHQLKNRHIEQSPNMSVNDDTTTIFTGGDGTKADKFWLGMAGLQDFFIDGCTAYSWTSDNGRRPGNNYQDDEIWTLGIMANAWDKRESGGATQGDNPGAPHWGGYENHPGNMKGSSGQPSRGIWGNGRYIDISWTGMGVGYNDNNWGGQTAGFPHMLSGVNGDIYGAASQFMQALVSPGQAWRFRRDPGETVYITEDFSLNGNLGYGNSDLFDVGTTNVTGVFGIRNFRTAAPKKSKKQYYGHNMRQRWTIAVTADTPIGSGEGGYSPTTGTVAGATIPVAPLHHDSSDYDAIELLTPELDDSGRAHFSNNPGVWETEPRESADIDIYFQASPITPIYLNERTNEEYIPIGSTFVLPEQTGTQILDEIAAATYTVTGWNHQTIKFTPSIPAGYALFSNQKIMFTKNNHYSLTAHYNGSSFSSAGNVNSLDIHGGPGTNVDNYKLAHQVHYLDWNNCWCFGNGVESDRIRDDYNAPQMDNGVKASSVLEVQSKEELRKHGIIWSGIYNNISGVNNTNQFIAGEAITKDLNPIYGSIQKLYNRDTQMVVFCEDKILRAETNRDLLFNADGNAQVIASNAVIGGVQAYKGDYGIATHPESFAATPHRLYFTDAMRGKVLSLMNDGINSISGKGMKDYFSDLFEDTENISNSIGTYDARKSEYNLSVYSRINQNDTLPRDKKTVSFSELSDGWTSLKSFYPESGVSINNKYFTFNSGQLYKHHSNETRNNFYGATYESNVTVVFNDSPGSVKSFGTINYEGSEARISNFDLETVNMFNNDYNTGDGLVSTSNVNDGEYFNLGGAGTDSAVTNGWYAESITTNLQTCGTIEFKDKEGKYYGQISGNTTILDNVDEREFTVQGLGTASIAHSTSGTVETLTFTVANNTSTTYGTPDWDATAD